MSERGLHLAHTTILRWVQRYAPEFIKCWNRFSRGAGRSWRVDETYVKIHGQWTSPYRAVDECGKTIDFRLSRARDVPAAKAFFMKAIRHEGRPPHTITLDGYAASHCAVREMRADGLLPNRTKLRSSTYLNNLIEQDHRGVKFRTGLCSASKASNLALSRSLAWNYSTVFKRSIRLESTEDQGPRCARDVERRTRRVNVRTSL